MDVGLIVDDSAMYSALFALLACVALAVELGRRPPKPKRFAVEEEDQGEKKSKGKADKTGKVENAEQQPAASPPPDASAATEDAQDKPSVQDQHTSAESLEDVAIRRANEVQDALADLQRTYVDGLLSPRGKYDVALAILNEYQAASSVSEKDVGLTMATEAYLSATRSGSIGSDRTPASQAKPKKEKDKSTTESTTPKKTEPKANASSDKSKPSLKGNKAKKTDDKKKPK